MTLKVKDAAKILGVGLSAMYALSKSEGFPRINIGKKILIPRDAFEEWVKAQIKYRMNEEA